MARNFHRNKPLEAMSELNVTPLIDVSLVLVVILLLATPLAFESAIAVRKSAEGARTAVVTEEDGRIDLRLVSDDMVHVNRVPVARDQLSTALMPLLEASPSRPVIIGCDGGVSHGAFVNVLDQAKLCGAGEISVRGR